MSSRHRALAGARLAALALTAAVVAGAAVPGGAESLSERPRQADAFVDTVGVVTHFHYRNTPYFLDYDAVRSLLLDAKIRHIRDSIVKNDPPIVAQRLVDLSHHGVRVLLVIEKNATPEQIRAQAERIPGAIEAFEAPNELDLSKDPDWVGEARDSTRMLRDTVRGGVPGTSRPIVIGPSLTRRESYANVGDLSLYLDYGNMHNYPGGMYPGFAGYGPEQRGSIKAAITDAKQVHGEKPVITTETGYCAGDRPRATPVDVNGIYEPRLFLEQYLRGVSRTYQYEFVDEGSPTSPFNQCGIVSNDVRPLPAYNALKGLMTTLADPGPSFEPKPLSYALGGDTADLHHALFEKRDGTLYLLLWLEKSAWDVNTHVRLRVAPQRVTLRGIPSSATVQTFDDDGNLQSRSLGNAGGMPEISVSDHVSIVRFTR